MPLNSWRINLLPDKTMIGALILSARSPVNLPYFHLKDFNWNDGSSPNGKTSILSPNVEDLFYPSKGREIKVYSLSSSIDKETTLGLCINLLTPSEDSSLKDRVDLSLLPESPELLAIHQSRPYSFTSVISKNTIVYFLGVYSEDFEALIWSNVEGFEEQFNSNQNGSCWFYRFAPRKDFSLLLNPKRLASRWFRYSQSSLMKESAKRFQALEKALFHDSTN